MENKVDVIDVSNLNLPENAHAKAYVESLGVGGKRGKLAEALAKAQLEFTPVKKARTADAGSYSYNYADLADVLDMCRPILAKHGIALTQPLRKRDGELRVVTRIELNGEVQESDGIAISEGLLPQEFGKTHTYWRRYDVSGFLSISTEDDVDAQKARKARGRGESFDKREETSNRLQERIKPFQVNAFNSACSQANRSKPEIAVFLKNLKHAGPQEITKGEFDMAIKWALAPLKSNGGSTSHCHAHGDYPGDGNCPTCELGITEKDTASVR